MQHLEPELTRAPPAPATASLSDASAGELLRDAVTEAKELVALEVMLAKDEVRREAVAAKSAGIALGVGAVFGVVALSLLFVALALAIFPGPIPALILGLILMVSATLAASAGVKLLPKKPLEGTRKRLEEGVGSVKERVR